MTQANNTTTLKNNGAEPDAITSGQVKSDLANNTQDVKETIQVLGDDLSKLGKSAAEFAKQAYTDGSTKASDMASENIETTRLKVDEAKAYATRMVKEKPLESIAVAFGIGWLISKILK